MPDSSCVPETGFALEDQTLQGPKAPGQEMFVVVFDPVAGGPLFVKVEDRDEHTWAVTKTHCAKALIVCATKEKAREVLGKMFGTGMHGWWTDNGGRFDTRYGTREQVDALIQSTGVRDIWDGEQLTKWKT